jgi:hypothetical protein
MYAKDDHDQLMVNSSATTVNIRLAPGCGGQTTREREPFPAGFAESPCDREAAECCMDNAVGLFPLGYSGILLGLPPEVIWFKVVCV